MIKFNRHRMSILFNKTCVKEQLLPNYPIYLYIYIKVCVQVWSRVSAFSIDISVHTSHIYLYMCVTIISSILIHFFKIKLFSNPLSATCATILFGANETADKESFLSLSIINFCTQKNRIDISTCLYFQSLMSVAEHLQPFLYISVENLAIHSHKSFV